MSELLTINEIAEHLRVSVKTFRKVVKEKSVPFTQVGKQMRFNLDKVLKYLEKRERQIDTPQVKSDIRRVSAPVKDKWTKADRKLAERLGLKL